MSDSTNGKVITLICERACDLNDAVDEKARLKDEPSVHVVKFPCSGMIQPLMVEAAFKAGAQGVIVTGCQMGDCYYREGNKMIRERLLGGRPPGLKKTVDRRRVLGLWLQRKQTSRLISEAKDFVAKMRELGPLAAEPAKPAPAKAAPATPKAATKDAADAAGKAKEEPQPAVKAAEKEDKKAATAVESSAPKSDQKAESKPDTDAIEKKE